MKNKLPSCLYGLWLLSLTLLFMISAPVLAQSKTKTESQIEAERTERQVLSPAGVITEQTSNRPMAFPDPYCGVNHGTIEPITLVEVAGISNRSSEVINGSPAHEDFTAVMGTMEEGESYTIALEGNTNGGNTCSFTVFIDWNQDGFLDNASERYEIGTIILSSGNDGQQATNTITVPAGATEGPTRMRVLKIYGPYYANNSCTDAANGQTEDYTIDVTANGGGGIVYCIPEATNAVRYIDNFSTTDGSENISNMGSGFSTGGYGDFYDTHTVAQAHGEDVEFSVDIVGGTAGFRVWVDWNQDGVFDETEEVAYASTGYQNNQTGSITVPSDALEGDTRMRIVSHWSSQTGDVDPCKTGFTYGEFEDYKFTVEGTIGIEVQSTTSFSYYPNPTNGVVNITANKDISSVAVYNILGQQVLDKDRLDNGQVDVSALSTGTYLFRVMFEDGSMETFKVLRK